MYLRSSKLGFLPVLGLGLVTVFILALLSIGEDSSSSESVNQKQQQQQQQQQQQPYKRIRQRTQIKGKRHTLQGAVAIAAMARKVEEQGQDSFRTTKLGPKRNSEPTNPLPNNFDWSSVSGVNYLSPNWNQHIPSYCGSCYIHSALSLLQDRINIAKAGRAPSLVLSRQYLINCMMEHGFIDDCNGGDAMDVFWFISEHGVPDSTCQVYTGENSKYTPQCSLEAQCKNCFPLDGEGGEKIKCWPVLNYTKYYVKSFGRIDGGEEAIMNEIYHRGPVVCGLVADDPFSFNYSGGVYTDKAVEDHIDHQVEVTGWGVTREGVKFWQVRNSWGSYWGENGFFKIIRGQNHLRIEQDCWYADPIYEDEERITRGEVTGSLYGLIPKDKKRAQESLDFIRSLMDLPGMQLDTTPIQALSKIGMRMGIDTLPQTARASSSLFLFTLILATFCSGIFLGNHWAKRSMRRKYSQI